MAAGVGMGRPVGMVRGERVNRAGRERAEKEHRDGMVRAERVNRAGRVLVRGETAPGAQVYREVFPG